MKYNFFTILVLVFIVLSCNSKNDKQNKTGISNEITIVGKWLVVESTFTPFKHISYCQELELNSVFEFKNNQVLNVYESLNGDKCTQDQSYKITDNDLSIREYDMVFGYTIQKLTNDTLELRIEGMERFIWEKEFSNIEEVEKIIEDIKENGFIITLLKIKTVANNI